ncbi:2,3-diaminopropionate biosynthesis protein SbnA [Streptomyces paradoxus]|uniref:Cysteine synthase A n=1 Tax=Streptomyces paradoxus TaxID=66375 RepID=A0A7W9TL70_9ACTN|nr:2,3-diaminopropionate biosynthesis protein SbnA [Streptomyces paradoxus]MBB6081642.1 cysteine synthase A [Streptomyces paradoxus]
MIHDNIAGAVGNTPVVRLTRLFRDEPFEVLAKLEYLNPLGSMKDRAARHVIESWLADGTVCPGTRLVESSSGNFGIALAALAPLYGLRVTCVLDPNTSATNLAILDSLGADLDMVWERDAGGGYLETRLARVRELVARDPAVVWVNQYANDLCWQAHYEQTAAEILTQVPDGLDVLVAAVSTTATLQGIARRLRGRWPALRVVAVDAFGSVIFGGPSAPRRLPGHGSSRVPELAATLEHDDVVYVRDEEAVAGCHTLLRSEGILAGASSGAVVSALRSVAPSLPAGARVLTLFADRGERYMDLVYAGTADARPADLREPVDVR